mgnify:CR=1 FL=1
MTIRIAVNGFGRIGRDYLRFSLASDDIEVVAINHVADGSTLARPLRYDSTLGPPGLDVAGVGNTPPRPAPNTPATTRAPPYPPSTRRDPYRDKSGAVKRAASRVSTPRTIKDSTYPRARSCVVISATFVAAARIATIATQYPASVRQPVRR